MTFARRGKRRCSPRERAARIERTRDFVSPHRAHGCGGRAVGVRRRGRGVDDDNDEEKTKWKAAASLRRGFPFASLPPLRPPPPPPLPR